MKQRCRAMLQPGPLHVESRRGKGVKLRQYTSIKPTGICLQSELGKPVGQLIPRLSLVAPHFNNRQLVAKPICKQANQVGQNGVGARTAVESGDGSAQL